MAQQREYYELYRRSSIGAALVETLDTMVNEGLIEPQLAMKALSAFDKAATEVLGDKVKAKLVFKGHLDTYRFCDEVWTFIIRDLTIKLDTPSNNITAEKVKVVSCNAKKPGET